MRHVAVDYKLAEFRCAMGACVVQKSKYDFAVIGRLPAYYGVGLYMGL